MCGQKAVPKGIESVGFYVLLDTQCIIFEDEPFQAINYTGTDTLK